MKKTLVIAALFTTMVACARWAPPAVTQEYEPLEISILPPSGGFGFWVNQPAYVAMFDITPGVGVRLLYPYMSKQLTQTVSVGSSLAHGSFTGYRYSYFAGRRLTEPHMILAIASRVPLNIHHTVGYSDWLTYKMGFASFTGSPLSVMNSLFDEVVPSQPEGDWATAMYLVYPDVPWRQNMYRLVRCPDGQIYVVNIETAAFYCPQPAPADKPTVDPDRQRRPETVRTGSAIARTMQNGQLPMLRPVGDVVMRPPSPLASRTFEGTRWSQQSSSSERSSLDYGRRPYPTTTASRPASSDLPATVARPPVDQPSVQPPQGQDPRREPARRENPAKEP